MWKEIRHLQKFFSHFRIAKHRPREFYGMNTSLKINLRRF